MKKLIWWALKDKDGDILDCAPRKETMLELAGMTPRFMRIHGYRFVKIEIKELTR